MKCAQRATPRSCRLENIIQKMPLYIGPDVDSAKGIPAEQKLDPSRKMAINRFKLTLFRTHHLGRRLGCSVG